MSWPANDLPEAVRSDLQGIIDEITEKGWVDIEVLPHEPNFSLRWNVGYPALEIPDGATLYCVTGRSPANGRSIYTPYMREKASLTSYRRFFTIPHLFTL